MKSMQFFTSQSLVAEFTGWFSAATLLVILVASGCNQPRVVQEDDGMLVLGSFVETSSLQRGVTVGSRTLVIESETGAVTITGTTADDASLLFTITARGDSQKEARAQIDKLVIEESGDDLSYTYNVIPDRDELTRINIEGEIPRNASLRLILRNGDITLTNVDGTIEVRQENGSIVYLGGSESLNLATLNGDVFADFYRLTSGSRATINVANGDVSLGIPETSNVAIDARTRAGSVFVHDLGFIDQRMNRRGAGAVFNGKLGTGTATVLLKTSNGNLTFNRVSLSAVPFEATPFEATPEIKASPSDNGIEAAVPDSVAKDTVSTRATPKIDSLAIPVIDVVDGNAVKGTALEGESVESSTSSNEAAESNASKSDAS